MPRRLLLLVSAVFWLGMMGWLWWDQYGPRPAAGSRVPVALVWDKILTAPDPSSLQILRRGTNIGFCRWTASAGEAADAALRAAETSVPGEPAEVSSYALELDGNIQLEELGLRLGYDFNLTLGRDYRWQEFHARFKVRPDDYRVDVVAATRKVLVRANAEGASSERTLTFADLQNPQKLLREAGGPFLPALLASSGLPLSTNAWARALRSPVWEARQDWLAAGRSRMRVYRLETRLLDRYRVRVSVSPAGEILQVDLPGDIRLQHETLGNFPPAS